VIDLNIDITELASHFNMSPDEQRDLLRSAVSEVAEGFEDQWRIESRVLFTSRKEYRDSIRSEWVDEYTKAVYLNPSSWLPNAIEQGASSFDMKVGLLNSSKAKTTAAKYDEKGNMIKPAGKYITVPFRFGNPDAIGDSFASMPRKVHQAVNAQAKSGNKGLTLSSIDRRHHMPMSAVLRDRIRRSGKNLNSFNSSKNKATSIYEGMRKVQDKKTNSSAYMTFRRVSLTSHKLRFVHSGFVARNLSSKALGNYSDDIHNIVGNAIDRFLE